MCEKCESQNNTYALQQVFLKVKAQSTNQAGTTVSNLPVPLFAAFIDMCKSNAKKIVESVSDQKIMIGHGDVVHLMMTAEHLAIEFMQQHFMKQMLEQHVLISKEIENLNAALTLIQSKAVISGDDTIANIAKDAIDG